jgi:hypothetical protein
MVGEFMNPREQIGKRLMCTKRAAKRIRKYMKRLTAKAERRDARQFGEEAPPRHWKGYVD